MTYIVFGGTLSLTQSINHLQFNYYLFTYLFKYLPSYLLTYLF